MNDNFISKIYFFYEPRVIGSIWRVCWTYLYYDSSQFNLEMISLWPHRTLSCYLIKLCLIKFIRINIFKWSHCVHSKVNNNQWHFIIVNIIQFFPKYIPHIVHQHQHSSKRKQIQLESIKGVIAIIKNTFCWKFNLLLFM